MIFDDNSKIFQRFFFSNLHNNLCCGCSLEFLISTHNIGFYEESRGDSNEHPQHRFVEDG